MPERKILVSYQLDSEHREALKSALPESARLTFLPDLAPPDRAGAISAAEVVVSWSPGKEFDTAELALLKDVVLLQLLSAGVDHLPFKSLPAGPVIAANTGAFAEPMAEHILGMALALAKRLCLNNARLARGEFDQATKNRLLRGLTFGTIGFGGIGQAAARLMRPLGLKIFALNSTGRTPEPVDFVGSMGNLDHVLKNSDILLIAIPLSKSTRGLIGRRELQLMKPDAILINAARGAIIDETALYEHLAANPGFSAGIDTWWIEPAMAGEFRINHPFFDLPNFLGSPHNSPIVPGMLLHAVEAAAENLSRFLSGKAIAGVVRREDYLEE